VRSTATSWLAVIVPLAIPLVTFLASSPVLENGFVNWDDEAVLLDNPHYRGLSWTHLRWMFTTFHMSVYRPVAWMTMGLDYLIWGMDPFGYHLTSLLFHCANALLFYFVALRLLQIAIPTASEFKAGWQIAAGFTALLFALHPLRVEPVAWESGEDNLVAGFFFMLTLICYLRAVRIPKVAVSGWIWMGGAWLCYGLSIISKALTVPLPLALLVMDVYPLKRLKADPRTWLEPQARRVLLEKAPFFFAVIPVAIIAVLAKQSTGAVAPAAAIGWVPRLMQSFYGVAFYLRKTIAPWGLSPLYERPIPFNPWDWPFVLSGAFVLFVTVWFFLARHSWPAGLAAWVYYVVLLLPSLGVITYGPQLVGDRYSYFPCLSWAVLCGAGMIYFWKTRIGQQISTTVFMAVNGFAVVLLIVLGTLTWKQAHIWHDSERLWKHALSLDERSSFAHNNLGIVLAKRGALDEAIGHFRRAVEIDPTFVEAYSNLGNFLGRRGSTQEAIEHLRHALQIDPGFANARNTLGNILAENGAIEEAIQEFQKAIETNPDVAITHYNLARALAKRGDLERAISQYRQASRIDPEDFEIHNNLGLLLLRQGHINEATEEFREAIRRNPNYAKAYFNVGKIYVEQGRLDDAVENFEKALKLEPEVAEIHENLGRVLALQGKNDQATAHLAEALRILKSQRPAS
jgi:tetratricopeptide (TPR) repeat protein